MITYKQLTAKTMPPEKRASASKCIIGHYLVRPISNIITIPLLELKISATAVTKVSCFFPIAAFFSFLLLKNTLGFWLGWLSILVWNILDGVDGNIARYTETSSKMGELWDAMVGWLAVVAFYYGMGFVASYHPGILPSGLTIDTSTWILLGSISAMNWIFPRLVMQKKNVLLGEESVAGVKKRANYNLPKLIFFNITSINGGAAVIFLVAYCFNFVGLCTIFYCFLSVLVAVGSLYSLMGGRK